MKKYVSVLLVKKGDKAFQVAISQDERGKWWRSSFL